LTGSAEDEDDLARPVASSLIQEEDSKLEETQPAFEASAKNESNIFRESFDLKEMERIQKILKGDQQ